MKFLEKQSILFFLLVIFSAGLFAQQQPLLKNLEVISTSEKLAYQKLTQVHEQLIVNNYDLKYHRFFLFADPAIAYISGAVTSYFVATLPDMNSIQFELSDTLFVDSAFYHGVMNNVNHTGNVITIPFSTTIPMGALDSVTVYYHGNPPIASGFGSFGTEIHGGAPAMWTLSEPYGASDWWPSKNDLTDKIDSIDVFIVTPKGNHVASNGLLISEMPYGTNSVLAHWKHRFPIASYLIAIASTNYARFSDYLVNGNDSLLILNYVYPEDSALVRAAAATVLPTMALFEELFTPYPFRAEKYGHAQFGWGGGMEHQTMTFLGRNAFNAEIIAHELAHQWFGDMITCGSWHDVWLNEGFATFCVGIRYEHIDTQYQYLWRYNNISNVCRYPGGSVYCDDTTNFNRIFDGRLSYSKGALLLQMLRWVMGDDNFFKGMKSYLNDAALRYKFAYTDNFKAHMESASGLDLTEFFADWYTGQGYPSYTVTAEPIQDQMLPNQSISVTIYQRQSHPSVSFFEMPVPIQFFGEGKDTLIVFNHTFSGEIFLTNPGFVVDSIKFDPDLWLISANNKATVGIDELPAGKELKLLPNPTDDHLIVIHNLGKISSCDAITMDGKSEKINLSMQGNDQFEIDTRNLKPGMYLLRIRYKEGMVTRKFIVKR